MASTSFQDTRTIAEMSKLNMEPYSYRGGDRFLGQGTFGKVLVMKNVSDGKEYAAKQYFCSFDWDEADKLQKLGNVGIYHRLSLQRLADFFSPPGTYRRVHRHPRRGFTNVDYGIPSRGRSSKTEKTAPIQ